VKILVLDGNDNQAVACVRSLGRAGHQVVTGASSSWSKAGWSRFCARTFVYPAPERDLDGFVRSVAEEAERHGKCVVLPMNERSTLALSSQRAAIQGRGGQLVLPPHQVVVRAFNKHATTQLAGSLGIATPATVLVENQKHAAELSRCFPLPAVLKPATSQEMMAAGGLRATGRPAYARTPQEFLAAYAQVCQLSSSILAQEFVSGTGTGYFALMREGDLVAEFAHRRVREVHPSGSGSSLRVSIEMPPRLRDAGLRLLRALPWHGVAMVEFRCRPDGTPIFLEVNGRFWQSLSLAIFAGVDFPALLVAMCEGGELKAPAGYGAGVRCRWLLGDFYHLLEVWRGAPPGYPAEYPGRLSTLLRQLTPVPGTFHDNFTWDDPLPELGDWLDFLYRRLPQIMRQIRATRRVLDAQRRYSHP